MADRSANGRAGTFPHSPAAAAGACGSGWGALNTDKRRNVAIGEAKRRREARQKPGAPQQPVTLRVRDAGTGELSEARSAEITPARCCVNCATWRRRR
jgi:hypothetical protein